MSQTNLHFKALVAGAPGEALGAAGEALLALQQQRSGAEVDAVPALRQASLELLRWLLRNRDSALAAEQLAFLTSGALADSVTVKDSAGQPLAIDLLSAELYDLLLVECSAQPVAPEAEALYFPGERWRALADGSLSPFDFNRPGRFKPHVPGQPRPRRAAAAAPAGPASAAPIAGQSDQTAHEVAALRQDITQGQQELAALLRQLATAVSGERLGNLLKELAGFTQFVGSAQTQLADSAKAGQVAIPAPEQQPAIQAVEVLHGELDKTLTLLSTVQRAQLRSLEQLKQLALQPAATAAAPAAPAMPGADAPLTAEQLKRIETDAAGMFASVSQYLINHPQRTAWSASRILIAEHFEKIGAPPEECIATPPRLLAALRRIQALHPNCFPPDDHGTPVLPPVIIEPGVGLVKWLDDRFMLSFVASDTPRSGSQLSLSPLDLAVLRIYGSYLARGDVWNYRGERLSDNFMAEYAGEIEQKVAVKFTGADKKMTYGTSAEEKDGASREDAVRDYLDFVFCVFNGQQLPKRITPRKVGVFLKYCLFRDLAFTVSLTLHLLAGADALGARAVILKHLPHDERQVIALCKRALESSTVLQTRYRRDLETLLNTVMGREFMDDARDAGLLGAGRGQSAAAPAGDGSVAGEGESAPAAKHDYFDL